MDKREILSKLYEDLRDRFLKVNKDLMADNSLRNRKWNSILRAQLISNFETLLDLKNPLDSAIHNNEPLYNLETDLLMCQSKLDLIENEIKIRDERTATPIPEAITKLLNHDMAPPIAVGVILGVILGTIILICYF